MTTVRPESRLQQSLDDVTRVLDRHRVLETLTHRQEGPKHDLLESLQHRQNLVELHKRLRAMHPTDVAFVLEALPPEDRQTVWEQIDPDKAGLGLHSTGRDSAYGSSVLLTFITDAMGFFLFLGLASAFLQMRLSSMRIVQTVMVFVLIVAAASVASAQRGPIPTPLIREGVTEKISEHVHVIPDNSAPLIPNVAIVVGNRATLVVDTGLGARNGEIILREVAKISKNSELYLATTHIHPEHDLGAHAFPPSTKMIRSNDQVREIAADKLETAKRFAGFSPAVGELLQGADFRKADVTFDKEHTIDLGGVRVRLMAMGFNHTAGDTAFFVEPDSILVSGDVAMSALPAIGADSKISTWLASMDRFEKFQPKRIVPSHGPMGDISFVTNYRAYLTAVRDRTVAHKKEGKTLDDTIKLVQDELGGKYDRNRMTGAIRVAYNEK